MEFLLSSWRRLEQGDVNFTSTGRWNWTAWNMTTWLCSSHST